MNARTILVLTALLASSALGDPPERPRYMSAAEREQMGIQAPAWDTARGKIDPRIHPSIREEEDLNRRSPTPAIEGVYKADRPVGLVGEMHVLVRLAPGKESAVLDNLSSWDFKIEHIFENHLAMTGWVGKDGLQKLEADSNVVSVSWDDTRLKRALEPPPAPTTQSAHSTKIESDVRRALEGAELVEVGVILEDPITVFPSGSTKEAFQQIAIVNDQLEKAVLQSLPARHFRLKGRLWSTPGFAGLVDREGLEQLSRHPKLKCVFLDREVEVPRVTTRPAGG